MVLTLMIPARKIYGLQDLITFKHIDNMAKIILLTGTIVGYAYIMELFIKPTGHMILFLGAGLMFTGITVMRRMINFDI